MNRRTMIVLHLGLATLFLPFMLVIPLSGGLYLLDIKGEQTKSEAFRIEQLPPTEKPEDFFRQQFKERGIDFDFEYIRASKDDFIFRPSTRVHYMASKAGDAVVVYKLEPDFVKRMIEIHKGHGPLIIRWLQVAFALALILVTLSGVYLAYIVPSYRKIMGLCFGVGVLLMLLGLF